jgi:polyisoprenoid-binding protein YceI
MSTPSTTSVPTGTWSVDPVHSSVAFGIKHLGIVTFRGKFKEFDGTITIGDDLASTTASGSVNVASIDTGDANRDGHLQGPEFFDGENNPQMTFQSTRIEPTGDRSFKVTGDLTIRGVTKPATFDAEIGGTEVDAFGNQRVGLAVTGEINRKDFGITYDQAVSSGTFMLSDDVKLFLDLSAVRQS